MLRFSLLLLTILLLIAGCVYYNTFFNAEKYFRLAQEQPLRDNGSPSPNAVQHYNNAIKKCGIVLTEYKDSKYADDALFLMARCFFYLGRNYTQAIKHFEELLEFYPESEFIPEARLYIARSNYHFAKKERAFELLQEFLRDAKFKDHHPQALQLLADYHLADRNFVEADYYLNRLIEKFPKSKEYANAFFLQGKAQYEAGNYAKSNDVFFSLLKSKVPRNLIFDARYYIALNYIMLKEYSQAWKYSLKLLKDEYRDDKIARIQLLKARSLAGMTKHEDAIQLFNMVLTDNPRSKVSAEACFFLGELYFNDLNNYEKAIASYNKVKTESSLSPFVEKALTRSSIASQIIQFHNPNPQLSVEELVLQQFKLAEFFIEYLHMPDSALVVYDHITRQNETFFQKLDSLRINLTVFNDSLEIMSQMETILMAKQTTEEDSIPGDVSVDPVESEEEIFSLLLLQEPDSTLVSLESDQLSSKLTLAEIAAEKLRLQSEINTLNQQIKRNEDDIVKYENEFIPFAEFIKLWLFKTVYRDSLRWQEQFDLMLRDFPDNKYTYAAELLLQDKVVEITTRQRVLELTEYEQAIGYLETCPDSARIMLQNIAADSTHSFFLKANFSLGYLNHFLLADSLAAKQHYDIVLAVADDQAFRLAVQKFYDGKSISAFDRLPALVQLEKKYTAEEEAARLKEAEELKKEPENQPDQLSVPDLNIKSDEIPPPELPFDPLKEFREELESAEAFIDSIVTASSKEAEETGEADSLQADSTLVSTSFRDSIRIEQTIPDTLQAEKKKIIEEPEPGEEETGEQNKLPENTEN